MSNALAIATVTEVLKQVLAQPADAAVAGATVSGVRPSTGTSGLTQKGINLFLYQVSANAAWRNADLPTRDSAGRLRQRPQAALDLHYLFSFYGDETLLETQRLLGATVRTLHAQPVIARATVRSVIDSLVVADPNHFLKDSNLADQVELVKFTPLPLSLEELSKIWSVFFQTPYALTVAYLGTVVLIEADDTPQSALPATSRTLVAAPMRQPQIDSVTPQMLHAGERLRLRGRRLKAANLRLVFGETLVTPPADDVRDDEIRVNLPAGLRAGVRTVRVLHEVQFGSPGDPHRGTQSNVAAFVLRPRITAVNAAAGGTAGTTDVSFSLDPEVGARQDVELLLNPESGGGTAHRVKLPARSADAANLGATVSGVAAGSYFVRVQVDGAESALDLDPASAGFGPRVNVP